MKRRISLWIGIILAGAGIMLAVSSVLDAQSGGGDVDYLSPVAVTASPDGKVLYVAAETGNQVLVFDPAGQKVTASYPTPGPATGVAVSPDGKQLLVTVGDVAGKVLLLEAAGGKVVKTIDVGHTPVSPVFAPDGKTAYVCNRFDDAIGVIDLGAGKQTGTIAAAREPVAMEITPDGTMLAVANLLPTGAADGAYIAATVSLIDPAAGKEVAKVNLPNGSMSLRGLAISPDGKFAYVTHILGRYQMPTTQLDRGWMNTNALSVVDIAGKKLLNTVLLDNIDRGAANPWGVDVSADGKFLAVTHAGSREISVIDREALHAALADAAAGKKVTEVSDSAEDVPNDLAFLVGRRRRIALPGNGPRGLVIAGDKAYAAEYFSDSLAVVDLTDQAARDGVNVLLGPQKELTEIRKGEMFFNSAEMCFQQWQSCATCHPDARADALNWDLLNDGIGNPKQTKSMLLAHETPPAMVSGVRGKAEVAVRAGLRFIQFAVRPEEDAAAIDAYLMNLKPVPSPYRENGKLSAAAERGKKLFDSAGCSGCHPAPLYTNLQSYDLGLGEGLDKGRSFDTPTLVECWRTAPFLYDGRAPTIESVLTEHNKDDQHGKTSDLTEKQIADLAEYVKSL
jgi:YVTN family beta-propeller protein